MSVTQLIRMPSAFLALGRLIQAPLGAITGAGEATSAGADRPGSATPASDPGGASAPIRTFIDPRDIPLD